MWCTDNVVTWCGVETTDIVHHISPLPLRFGRPIDMRKPKPASRKPPDTLIQRLRQAQNATLNRVAFARLRSTQPVPEAPQPEPYPSDSVDDVEMSNNPYNPDLANQSDVEASSDEEQGDQVRWVNLAQPTDDDQPQRIDPAIESHQEQYRLLMKEYNWTRLMRSLHTWYMITKLNTNNWSGPNAYEEFPSPKCKCLPSKKKFCYVDLVDLYVQRRTQVEFCKCLDDAVRLLKRGYLPGSPVKPQTAFSLPLLIFHHHMWNHSHIGMQPFTLALTEFLEPRSERLFVEKGNHARDMRKPFSATVDLFRQLQEKTDHLVDLALQLTEQQILAGQSCPACFGPEPANSSDYPPATRNRLCICLDGNFQHRHHSKASRNYETLQYPRIFLKEDTVELMTAEIRHFELANKTTSQADRCADAHKAADDKRNESTWKGCDDTGLMGCCCRHDSAIYLTNIYKAGEQRSMPLALLKKLLGVIEEDRPVGVLYDIGCSLDKYIKLRGLLPNHAKQLTFGTSIFHSYVHNWMCQLDYNPRFNTGWGMSDGEGLERMWSYLSPLGYPANAPLAFEEQNPFKNPGRNYTISYFQKQWKHQQTFRADHTDGEQDRRDKLIKIYEHEGTLTTLRERLLDPELHLLPEKDIKKIIKSIEKVAAKLKADAEGVENLPSGDENTDEQRLKLLIWNSKQGLYIQAVQLRAERQPLLDAKKIGTRVGTELKEKILKAIRNRRPAVKKLIDKFNKLYSEFSRKFPTQPDANSPLYPIEYEEFSKWPLDHEFWNDGLYFHSKDPWAIEPDVRTGINCVLILSRVQEEFQLIAQELARAVGWATEYYDRCKLTIQELNQLIDLLAERPDDVELNRFDNIDIHGVDRRGKLKMIRKELRQRREAHTALLKEWHPHVMWLAKNCQPTAYCAVMLTNWQKMKAEMEFEKAGGMADRAEVNGALEEVVLDVALNDGEDVEDDQISGSDDDDMDVNVPPGITNDGVGI
ncbi:hypothetical protein Pst134EB_010877 [Puccinia striiformis f. sp. tritici]|nr:hypothetical protein Pst134EB_010877 [Puccinia striiformis f. sp. tritici]